MKLSRFEKQLCLLKTGYAYILYVGVYAGIKILETGVLTIGISDIFTSCILLASFYLIFYLLQKDLI